MIEEKETNTISEFEAQYDFSLDGFQREAIEQLLLDRSVLVAAPTGSGKTVVAEFAVWMAEKGDAKTFYTTPLKALSNQKYRDFCAIYGTDKVGLLTGDNSINPDAPVVIMTTEVLRNMIYERSFSLYGLRFVVLDECHYLMDPFRGAVWEEIIIQLPVDTKIVGLSATVSNYQEFGEWLNDLRGDLVTIYNDHRPVPLRHYYMIGGTMVNLLSNRAPQVVSDYEKAKGRGGKGGKRLRTRHLIPRRSDVVARLHKSGMLPAIYFIFSRAGCDAGVTHCMDAGLDLTSPEEKKKIEAQVMQRMSWLPPEDLRVFGFEQWLEALMQGISSHHAGHLPIFKEVVEDLFAQGLVKAVFATETLSLGINMPAKTVVIESLYKFSGESHEFLTPTEYTQFTGRAGRRGIDKVGNAVTLYNPVLRFTQVQKLAEAESLPIRSSFTLSYNMAVNLLRYNDMESAVHLLNSSFAQFHADRDVVRLERAKKRLSKRLEARRQKIACDRGNARKYYEIRTRVSRMEKELAEERRRRRRELVERELEELAVGDVIVMQRKGTRRAAAVLGISEDKHGHPRLTTMDSKGHYLKASHNHFPHPPQTIGHLGTAFLPADTKGKEKKVRQALANFDMPPPRPREDETQSVDREELAAAKKKLETQACHTCERRKECMEACKRMQNIQSEIGRTDKQMEARCDVASRRLENVSGVLSRLDYLEGGQPTAKGLTLSRVYNECDLLLVECLVEGVFDLLNTAEMAAFASIFVFESRDGAPSRKPGAKGKPAEPLSPTAHPTPALEEAIARALSLEGRIKSMERKERLDLLRPVDTGFVKVVYEWACGEDMEYMTSVYPQYSAGDFVRSMKQVLDILRQIREITRDPELSSRLSEAMDGVHRSVIAYTSVVDAMEEELEKEHGAPPRGETREQPGD
ncbi:MAG: DEAD/DEAH box helicase [Actinomycetota bacterium]|nr:DEAD/DEAH box helicase [Actinomycetota bacterium]